MKLPNFKSIKIRTLIFILPLILVSLFVMSYFGYQTANSIINMQIKGKMDLQLSKDVATIQKSLSEHSRVPESIAKTIEATGNQLTKDQITALLENHVTLNTDTYGLGVFFEPYKYKQNIQFFGPYAYKENNAVLYTDDYSAASYNYPQLDWYKNAKDTTKSVVWSMPFVDSVSKIAMVTASAPFYDKNKNFIGVAEGDVNLSSIQKIVDNIKASKTGESFLIDSTGLYMTNSDPKKVMKANIKNDDNKNLAALATSILTNNKSSGEFKDGNDTDNIYYSKIPETGWVLATVIPQKELYQDLTSLMNSLLIIGLIILLLISGVVFLLITVTISRPITEITKKFKSAELGDYTSEIPQRLKSRKDEIGKLAVSYSAVLENISVQAKNAQLISQGDLNLEIVPKSKNDVLAISMKQVVSALKGLVSDVNMLSAATVQNKFDIRADTTKHQGDYRLIVEGVNDTLDVIVDKVYWYEAMLDAIPSPISVSDMNYKWQFVNKATEAALNAKRKDIIGRQCTEWGSDICKSEDCGMKKLRKGENVSFSKNGDMRLRVDLGYIKNIKGEEIGIIEIIKDITSQSQITEYLDLEVGRVAGNLKSLSSGNVDFDLNISAGSKYTSNEFKLFLGINDNLKNVQNSINLLIDDSAMLSSAAVDGRLSVRADAAKHQGDFKKIVEGINATLDAVITPIHEAETVLNRISVNDYSVDMSGKYQGDLHILSESINNVMMRLLSVQDAFVKLSIGDMGLLEKFEKIGKRSDDDKLIPSIIAAMRSIRDLVNESNILANAAVNGDLSVRGNADKFAGGYKEIIEGMNQTMKAIERPLNEISEVLSTMENSDFTITMNGEYKGEYLKIKEATNNTIKAISEVLTDMGQASDQVAGGSKQVSDASQSLSQGASEQASAVEQLSASIAEVAAQTRQNAANATEANELTNNAKKDADTGAVQMLDMIKSMEEINESSVKVAKVIKVIDDIAFQTNMLALNAAVEAARAGQHGKGFAVVADEVRNLAARSANAVKETSEMIENSLKRAADGTKIANETKVALDKIVVGVDKATVLVAEIAAASNEQATGIAQINRGIEQVAQVVQTNSATSEESAASSEELSGQAELLKQMVKKFKLSNSSERYVPKPAMSPRAEFAQAAAAKSPRKITLNQNDFGKY